MKLGFIHKQFIFFFFYNMWRSNINKDKLLDIKKIFFYHENNSSIIIYLINDNLTIIIL